MCAWVPSFNISLPKFSSGFGVEVWVYLGGRGKEMDFRAFMQSCLSIVKNLAVLAQVSVGISEPKLHWAYIRSSESLYFWYSFQKRWGNCIFFINCSKIVSNAVFSFVQQHSGDVVALLLQCLVNSFIIWGSIIQLHSFTLRVLPLTCLFKIPPKSSSGKIQD